MIEGIQIKMARAALGLGVRDLAQRAGVAPSTVQRIEAGAPAMADTLRKLQRTLEGLGVSFVPENGGGVGVRLKG